MRYYQNWYSIPNDRAAGIAKVVGKKTYGGLMTSRPVAQLVECWTPDIQLLLVVQRARDRDTLALDILEPPESGRRWSAVGAAAAAS